ncbi:MAG: glycoside hydrolase family 140 protein [Prolixibacteraceae bacterium]
MRKLTLLSILFFTITTIVNAKDLPLLKISKDKHYIVNEDNNPFLWLGDTAWELIHRLNKEELDRYFKDRSEKGFTVIQTVILAELDGLNTPNAYGEKPLINNDPTQLNEKYFEFVDYVVKRAEHYGLYLGLLPTWGDKFNLRWGEGPVIFNAENAQKYGEIIAKRYQKQSNIIWILGGDRLPETEAHYAVVRAMAKGIRAVDQQKLISYHPSGANKASDVFNDEWLNLDMFQSGHSRDTKDYRYVWESRKTLPKRPVINGEPRYENIPDRFWEPGDHPWLDQSDVRVCAYWSMLAGAAGYTYGCNDIWQMYSPGRQPTVSARTGWEEALQLPGSSQMNFLRALFESFPWQNMVNDQSIILNENSENEAFSIAAIGNNKEFVLAYTPWGHNLTIDLSKMKASKVSAYWFNPRSGESTGIGQFDTTEKPVFKPWALGRGSDFILVLISDQSNYQLP